MNKLMKSKHNNLMYEKFVIDPRLKCVIGTEDPEKGIIKKLTVEDVEYCKKKSLNYMDLNNK